MPSIDSIDTPSSTIASSANSRLLRIARTMSTSATTSPTPAHIRTAPWRPQFLTHLSTMDSPEFVLTSLAAAPSTDSPVPYVPHARFCIFRGMWAELPENRHNAAPRNARAYASDLLTLTTDVRMAKVPEIFASSRGGGGGGEEEGRSLESGGGGPVEAVFWAKEVMTQWRFRGEAYVVGPDIEGEESSGTRTVKSRVGERMRVVDEEEKGAWSWGRELTAHFGNLTPGMRGSFANPPPGTPKSIAPSDKSLVQGQHINDLNHEAARKNFRVLIIKPDEVEQLDLSVPDKARRWKYTYVAPTPTPTPTGGDAASSGGDVTGEWKREELWP